MKKFFVFTGTLAVFMVIAPSVKATVLAPGGAPEPVAAEVLPAGSIVSNGGNVSVVSFTGVDAQGHTRYQGTLYFAVYQEAATGYLDFLYQIQNSKKSRDSLERTSNVDFSAAAGFVDASYLIGGAPSGFLKGSRAPSTADLSDDSSVVGFNFPSGKTTSIGPGITTDVYVIGTHVKAFRAGSTSIINGAVVTIATFAPGPEPSTLVLFAGCFLGLAGWAGWRRWKHGAVSS